MASRPAGEAKALEPLVQRGAPVTTASVTRERSEPADRRGDSRYVTLSALIDADLKRRLKARAVAEDRKMWQLLEAALEQYLR
jgi:hypothetical protein